MHVHYLQHVPFEGLGSIKAWVNDKGFKLTSTRLYDDESLPNVHEIDCVVIMGGPMFVYDEDKYPWLIKEKQFIRQAINANKLVLGICLGAQLIADVLGAAVTRSARKEIGWFPIQLTDEGSSHRLLQGFPQELMAFHWHSDTFSIPEKATRIAFNQHTANQGFIYKDHVLALQCHLETTPHIVNSLVTRFGDELTVDCKQVQTAEKMLAAEQHFTESADFMYKLLDNLYSIKEQRFEVA